MARTASIEGSATSSDVTVVRYAKDADGAWRATVEDSLGSASWLLSEEEVSALASQLAAAATKLNGE